MKTKILVAVILLIMQVSVFGKAAQLNTQTGHVWFYSKAMSETIEAHNKQVAATVNTTTGDVGLRMLIKSFSFEKKLIEEPFNENYMESDKFPKSSFKGKIANINSVNFEVDGTYQTTVDGDLTIHGVTKKVSADISIEVSKGDVKGISKFKVKPKDYRIKIPTVVADKISEQIEINVDINFKLAK
jgi:hypothetical protein